jgi:type I restriction enzyme S subunit
MEKRTGYIMVNAALKYEQLEVELPKNPLFLPSPLRYGSVSIAQMVNNGHRYDASAYNIEAMSALRKVMRNKYGFIHLLGAHGLVKDAIVGSRFKRIYTDNHKDIPFYLPSDIENVYPKASKYISAKTDTDINALKVESNMLLMSVSGTIGKTAIVRRRLDNCVFSHDLLRVVFKNDFDLGYVYAFLNTETGLLILQSNNYGAVIDHIEPEHLANVPIPNAAKELKEAIHNLIVESYDLRDKSNDLIDEAQALLYKELQLPNINTIKGLNYAENKGFQNYVVKASQLNGRLDGSYHIPEARELIDMISRHAKLTASLNDKKFTKQISVGNRFKRIYVDKNNGVPYLNGKSICQLDPNGCQKKYLSLAQHEDRIIEQLTIKKNTILITCSGTLGKVVLVPQHWEGWAGTHDLIRVYPVSDDMAGYIYCYLQSEAGKVLINRLAYGSVVDHIEPCHISQLPIPILKNIEVQQKINNLVLEANELRYQAYLKEQEAINKMNEILTL